MIPRQDEVTIGRQGFKEGSSAGEPCSWPWIKLHREGEGALRRGAGGRYFRHVPVGEAREVLPLVHQGMSIAPAASILAKKAVYGRVGIFTSLGM